MERRDFTGIESRSNSNIAPQKQPKRDFTGYRTPLNLCIAPQKQPGSFSKFNMRAMLN